MDENLSNPRPGLGVWWPRVVILIAIFIGVGFAGWEGMRFRHWMWDTTVPIRFLDDIDRGYDWGRQSATEGYLNQYEKMQFEQPHDRDWLDYGPLRLAVMACWGKWSLTHFPDVTIWRKDHSYALTAPVLHFNLLMETIGVVSAFFLARLWSIRGSNRQLARDSLGWFFRGWIPGLLAAALLWFNPAIVLSAYGWPTWDLWIIPMFLLTALLASVDWWFAAGIAIGIGAMLKGQQLMAIPVFVIWSVWLGQPLASLRFCCGVVIAIGIVVLPWMTTYLPADALASAREIQSLKPEPWMTPPGVFHMARVVDVPAILWITGVFLASIAGPVVSWLTLDHPPTTRWRRVLASPWAWRGFSALLTILLVIWPWLLRRNHPQLGIGTLLAIGFATAVLLIRPRGICYLAAGAVGIALLLCMSVFHGSTAWYDCGIHFGTIHWPGMIMGLTDNLPAILQHDFNWNVKDIVFTIEPHLFWHQAIDVSMRQFLIALFWITLLISCMGVGLHARRRHARILIALSAVWLMFFCFPPQIHERYLLFAAGISSVCTAAGTGMTLLGIFLSITTFAMTLNCMLAATDQPHRRALGQLLEKQFHGSFNNNSGETLLRVLNGTHPDAGYAVVLCGLVFLYFAIAPGTKDRILPISK